MALVIGAAMYGADLTLSLELILLSGGALAAEELYRHGLDWFRWVQAWVVLAKLGLFVVVLALEPWRLPALWIALVLGALISHATGKVRQHPLWGDPGPCATK
ncbi:MAG: hypothetical protein GY884_02930 [Proteobacteria bacterium]|nr:hypothetical protein [Pseudomonadota bacterium]